MALGLDEQKAPCHLYENGTREGFKFGKPVDGKPEAKMRATSLKLYDFELAAIFQQGAFTSAFTRLSSLKLV